MVIFLHILIALASIGIATVALFKPSMKRLIASYGFIIATTASGVVLLITSPSTMLHTCVSGATYLTVVSIMTIAAHVRVRRLAPVTVDAE